MSVLDNYLVQAFLDDMAFTVGVRNWLLYAAAVAAVTYGLMVTSILPYADIIGGIMTANLAVAAVVAVWWKRYGRPKRRHSIHGDGFRPGGPGGK